MLINFVKRGPARAVLMYLFSRSFKSRCRTLQTFSHQRHVVQPVHPAVSSMLRNVSPIERNRMNHCLFTPSYVSHLCFYVSLFYTLTASTSSLPAILMYVRLGCVLACSSCSICFPSSQRPCCNEQEQARAAPFAPKQHQNDIRNRPHELRGQLLSHVYPRERDAVFP